MRFHTLVVLWGQKLEDIRAPGSRPFWGVKREFLAPDTKIAFFAPKMASTGRLQGAVYPRVFVPRAQLGYENASKTL